MTAFAKNKVERKPLAPLNNTKQIPTSPKNHKPAPLTPRKLFAKPSTQNNDQNQKAVRPKIKS